MLDFNHIYKVLATSILETISPTRCVVCDAPGEILCAECAAALPFIDLQLACPRCGAPFGKRLCTECPNPESEQEKALLEQLSLQGAAHASKGRVFPFVGARAALSYEGGAKSIIRVYKDGDELRLAATIASFICNAMRGRGAGVEDWTQWADALVYIPASPEAVLRRGFDHMERIANICGERTGVPVLRAIESTKGTLDQRELGRAQRIANRSESFCIAPDMGELPAHIVLIDDVLTTGATMTAATCALLNAGAQEVAVVTCARVW